MRGARAMASAAMVGVALTIVVGVPVAAQEGTTTTVEEPTTMVVDDTSSTTTSSSTTTTSSTTVAASTTSTTVAAGTTTTTSTPPSRAACPETGTETTFTSPAQARAAVVGAWLQVCGERTALWTPSPGEVGIEFTADGRVHRLYDDGDGGYTRAAGLLQDGTWTMTETTGPGGRKAYQVDTMLVGYVGAANTVSQFNGRLRFADVDGYTRWDYVALAVAPHDGPVPTDSEGFAEAFPCGVPTDQVELSTAAQVRGLLTGTWVSCRFITSDGTLPTGVRNTASFELAADGRVYHLRTDDAGNLVRIPSDYGDADTWTVVDSDGGVWPGRFHIDMPFYWYRTSVYGVVLFDEGTFLHLNHFMGPSDYRLWGRPSQSPEVAGESVTLPRTGAGTTAPVAAALALMVGGAVVLAASRRARLR